MVQMLLQERLTSDIILCVVLDAVCFWGRDYICDAGNYVLLYSAHFLIVKYLHT